MNCCADHTVGIATSVLPSASSVACATCARRKAFVASGARKLRPPSLLSNPPAAVSTQTCEGCAGRDADPDHRPAQR